MKSPFLYPGIKCPIPLGKARILCWDSGTELSMPLDCPVLPRSDMHKAPPQTLKKGSPPRQEYHPTYRTISPCPHYCKKQKNKLLLDGGLVREKQLW